MADPLTANHKAPEHTALELEHRGRDRREVERQNLALLGTINEMGGKIRRDAESNWHFSIEAPRWAVRSPEGNTATAIVAGVAAFLLAGFAFWLAWHATDELVGSQSALTVQIGPWAAVGALLVAAGAAAYAAMGSSRLRLRMTQLAGGEAPARALAASASADGQAAGPAGAGLAAANIGLAAAHVVAADQHVAAAVGAAGDAPAAAPRSGFRALRSCVGACFSC